MSSKPGTQSRGNNRPVAVPDSRTDCKLFVCAIDFGTTYSGYASSTRQDVGDIFCPNWNSASTCTTLISHKAPTTVLLDAKKNFIAFGFDAETKFLEFAEEEEANNLYYFRRFKMILYDKLRDGKERLSTKTTVADIYGKELPAVDIFSHAIKYLKDHMINEHKNRGTTIVDSDINWVLTVPAIWDDPAKQFMRKAAEKVLPVMRTAPEDTTFVLKIFTLFTELVEYISMAISSDHYSLVCAIDFGTTFSGIAYSLKREYRDDPTKITVHDWSAPSSVQISYKTPTTILLDSKRKFVAFGYEAESKYAEFAEDEEHDDYFYCRRFKMLLYDTLRKGVERLTMNTKIKDITEKKEMLAIDIFSLSIKYFRDLMVYTVDKKGIGVKTTDIRWVLTVPAMWSDPAKQFMTEAAQKAGISRDKLMLALEPEAASIYCSRLPLFKLEGAGGMGVFEAGKKYLVLDAGGGTVDITVHEVTKDNNLKELEKASGGDWGGTSVDNDYKKKLMEVVGDDFMEDFRLKYTGEYIELFRDFEMKKRTPLSENQTMVTMRMPGMLSGFYEERKNQKLKEAFRNSTYNKSTRWEGDKLRITPAFFKNFFSLACVGIVDHVRDLLLEKLKYHKIDTILMVGGFSESPILQKRIREEFPDHRIVVPNEAGLAVLKGAVLFGHNPNIISERVAKYSYGIASFEKFDHTIHKKEKKDNKYCKDVFDVHVRKGSRLVFNDEIKSKKEYEPNRDDQMVMDFDVYLSEEEDFPKYVTDPGCQCLGTLSVDLPKPVKGKKRGVFICMIFGGTELCVKAVNRSNNEETSATFNFLGNQP